MNHSRRGITQLLADILSAGIRVMFVVVLIQIILFLFATGAGIYFWIKEGLLYGSIAGFFTFTIGQAIAYGILDMTLELPEKAKDEDHNATDEEALKALRAELDPSNEFCRSRDGLP